MGTHAAYAMVHGKRYFGYLILAGLVSDNISFLLFTPLPVYAPSGSALSYGLIDLRARYLCYWQFPWTVEVLVTGLDVD